jgi:hypothetical protein
MDFAGLVAGWLTKCCVFMNTCLQDLVTTRDSKGNTPLILAAAEGRVECVQWLLCYGAAVNMTNAFGDTALHFAAESWHNDVCLILLRCGADTEIANAVGVTAGNILYGDDEDHDDVRCLTAWLPCGLLGDPLSLPLSLVGWLDAALSGSGLLSRRAWRIQSKRGQDLSPPRPPRAGIENSACS